MNTNEPYIRLMTADDIDGVMEVELSSFTSPWKEDDIYHDLTRNPFSDYLVVEKDDEIIGYCGAWTVADSAQITNIAISPHERGNGYGEMLLKRMIELVKIRGASQMSLEVRKSNYVAQNLYKQYGFKPVGIRENYYQDDGEDAIVMWVELT